MNDGLPKVKEPIQGWLVLVGIELWLGGIVAALGVIVLGAQAMTHTLPNTSFVWFQMGSQVISAIWAIWVLALFIQRKQRFITWFVGLNVWAFLVQVVEDLLRIVHFALWPNAVDLLINVLLILYILFSKRVRRTFVR